MSEKSKPEQLKEVLFMAIEDLKSGGSNLEEIRTIACTANSICNVVRTELKVAEFNERRDTERERVSVDF
jgi:hypothetical protein